MFFIRLLIFFLYFISTISFIYSFTSQKEKGREWGRYFFFIAFTIHFFYELYIIWKIGYIPFSNGISALAFSGFLVGLAYLLMTFISKSDTFSFLVVPFIFFSQIFYTFSEMDHGPLTGIFSSRWFQIHVSMALLSFSSFLFGFLSAVLYLMLYRELSKKKFGKFYFGLNSLDELGRNLFYSNFMGLFFLIFAIYTGHRWLEEIGNLPNGINTRIYSSYFTFLIYFILVIMKLTGKVSGKKIALFSILGFFLMVIAFAFGGAQ